jgi:hypothetical protein
MKRLLFITIISVVMMAGRLVLPAFAQEQQKIPVLIDGLPVVFDVLPIIQNGRTLVPFRAIAEALNVKVDWDGTTQTISATDGKTSIRLQIGNKTAHRNDSPILLDVPPQILGVRTLIPLRFFSEAFDCQVNWDNSINGVRITSPPKEMTVIGFYALGDSKTSSWTNIFGKPYPETDRGNTDVVGELALGRYSLDKEGNLLTKSRTGWQRPDGELADRIIIMAYDYGSKPEPVSLVTQAVEIARASVPPEKLVLGISASSETPESILIKVGIAKRYGLDGIAIWRLGLVTGEMWDALRANVIPRR